VTLIEAVPRPALAQRSHRFTIELFDGRDFATAGWPSIDAGSEFLMHVFQSREFLETWMATIGRARNAKCFLIVVRDGDERPVLYLPLSLETRFDARILRFMDAGIAGLNAPILVAGRNLTRSEFFAIWAEILSLLPSVDVVDFQRMPSHVCAAHNPFGYFQCRPHQASRHVIDLTNWPELGRTRGPTVRMQSKLRRHHRRLSRIDTAAFLINPSGAQRQYLVERLAELKRSQYRRTQGSFFAAPGVQDFYRALAAPERLGRISHLSALACGGHIVAAHLGFLGRDRFHYVLPAFDLEYRSFAVGLMLLDHLVEHCAERAHAVFDLGEGDYSYKRAWETHLLPLLSFEQGLTAAGLLYAQRRRAQLQEVHAPWPDPSPPRVVPDDHALRPERWDH
jgi:CelD/BcsL family acetyltransferase involved in cellulose biosynthesis